MKTFEPVDITPTYVSTGWHDVDLSTEFGADAGNVIGVQIMVRATSTRQVQVRKNGSSDALRSLRNIYLNTYHILFVGVDSSDIFEMYLNGDTGLEVYLMGYWTSADDAVFLTNLVDVTPTFVADGWHDVDVSSQVGGDTPVGVILQHEVGTTQNDYMTRKNGSTSTQNTGEQDDDGIHGGLEGVDGSQIFEVYLVTGTTDVIHLAGWINDQATFLTNRVSFGSAGVGSYQDETLTTIPSGAGHTTALLRPYNVNAREYWVRANGATFDGYGTYFLTEWTDVALPIDETDRIVEHQSSDTQMSLYLVGYAEEASGNAYTKDLNETVTLNDDPDPLLDPAWYNASWGNRIRLTIPKEKVTGTHTDFPVYVDLGQLPSGTFWANVLDGGGDIRMTTEDGETEIAREVVFCDATGEAGELHFKAPTLTDTRDNHFYIYYNNSGASEPASDATYGSENTWNSSYRAVYHLQEEGNTTAGGYADSTANGNHGTGVSMTASSDVAGKLSGKGQTFDNTADYITLPDGVLDLASATAEISVQAWVNLNNATDKDNPVISGRSLASGNPIFTLGVGYDGADNDDTGYAALIVRDDASGGLTHIHDNTDITGDGWHMLHATRNSSKGIKIYVDGNEEASGTDTMGSAVNPANPAIGAELAWIDAGYGTAEERYLHGDVDEVRIYVGELSAGWIATEYQNQNDIANFITQESEESAPGGCGLSGWDYRTKLTIANTEIDAALSNFPVYVDLSDMPAAFWSHVKSDGGDIRVTESDGETEVPVEVVFIDTGAETGELHFRATSISNSVDTDFYIYYGNSGASLPAVTATYGRNNVWSNGFVGVWHMQQDPSAGNITDSTGNGNDFVPNNLESGDLVDGKLSGKCIVFDGTNEYMQISDNATFDWEAVTVTAWAQTTTLASDGTIFVKNAGGSSEPLLWFDEGVDDFTFAVVTGSGFINGSSGGSYTTRSINTWYYAAGVFDGSEVRSRVNGVENFSAAASGGITNTAADVATAAEPGGTNRQLSGRIDELRVADVGRTDEWLDAEYSNQNNPTGFYTLGSEEGCTGGSAYTEDLAEVVTLVDVIAKGAQKSLSESVVLADNVAMLTGKALGETIVLADNVSFAVNRLLIETITLVDTVAKGAQKTLEETITLVDNLAIVKALERAFTETLTLADTVLKQGQKTLTETITLVDNLNVVLAKILVETITLTDTVGKQTARVFEESITLVDSVAKQAQIAFNEAITLVDTVGIVKALERSFSEVVTLTDTLAKRAGKSLVEVLTLVDSFAGQSTLYRTLEETVTLADTVTSEISRRLVEVITLADNVSIAAIYRKTLTETIALTDTLVRQTYKVLNESLVLTDTVGKQTQVLFEETVTLTDTLAKQTVKVLRETITVTDTFLRNIYKSLVEALTLDDTLTTGRNYTRVFQEAITLVDVITNLYKAPLKKGVAVLLTTADKAISTIHSVITTLRTTRRDGNVLKSKRVDRHSLGSKDNEKHIL